MKSLGYNNSANQTAFTVSIEAKYGVTTGVSATVRVTTIKTAANSDARPSDLARPGHIFPLRARTGGVMIRRGHTDGTMAKTQEIIAFGKQHNMPVLTIEDMVLYRRQHDLQLA